jgi:hypothetical protein
MRRLSSAHFVGLETDLRARGLGRIEKAFALIVLFGPVGLAGRLPPSQSPAGRTGARRGKSSFGHDPPREESVPNCAKDRPSRGANAA